jgi:predicted anti-sigma-YlaC factor YlaD
MGGPIPVDECTRAREWASLRLDDQLSDFEEVLLEAHLALCDDCRAFAASISDLTAALRFAPLERPELAFEAPRTKTRGRTFALRAVSAAAAVAVVGVSSLVGLELSAGPSRPRAPVVERKVMDLKERQLNELAGGTTRQHAEVPHGLAAVEQVIVGTRPPANARMAREGFRPVTRTPK